MSNITEVSIETFTVSILSITDISINGFTSISISQRYTSMDVNCIISVLFSILVFAKNKSIDLSSNEST